MANKKIDVNINAAVKGGFSSIAKQLSDLNSTLLKLQATQASFNKTAAQFAKDASYAKASQGIKKVADAQKSANKEVAEGAKLAKQNLSLNTQLANSLSSLRAAQKSGAISAKTAAEAEVNILKKHIRTEKELKDIQAQRLRSSAGKFVGIPKSSLDAIRSGMTQATTEPLKKANDQAKLLLVTLDKAANKRIKAAVETTLRKGSSYSSPYLTKTDQQNTYNKLFDAKTSLTKPQMEFAKKSIKPASDLQSSIDKTAGIKSSDSSGIMMGDDAKFNRLKMQYQALEARASKTSSNIKSFSFAPDPSKHRNIINQLIKDYNNVGYALGKFQLATIAITSASGIAGILAVSDEYTVMRNQISRTSESVADVGKNMKEVFDISKTNFIDVSSVAKMYTEINGLRDALGLTKSEVGGVTSAITGAFAASSGTSESKSQAQYQLTQAISSNKLGGDELRSIAEQADYVKSILIRYAPQVRGGKKGDAFNLYDKENPLSSKELSTIFNMQEVQAEIKKAIGDRARTFGDVLAISKTRLVELSGSFDNATGLFAGIAGGLARFLSNDESFTKFTNALEIATIAIGVFATNMALTSGSRALQAGAGALGNRLATAASVGRAAKISTGTALFAGGQAARGATGSAISAVMAAPGAIAGAARVGGKAIGSGVSATVKGLGVALDAIKNPAKLAKDSIGLVGKGFSASATAIKNSWRGISTTFKNLGGISGLLKGGFSGLVKIGSVLLANIGGLTAALFSLGIPFVLVGAAIVLFIYQFNKMLGTMNQGMTIFDVVIGLWNQMAASISALWNSMDTGFFKPLKNVIEGTINWLRGKLEWLVKLAGENEYIRDAQTARNGGSDRAVTLRDDRDGKNYQGQINYKTGLYEFKRDKNNSRVLADQGALVEGKVGQKFIKGGNKAPTGDQFAIATKPDSGTNSAAKEAASAAKALAKRWAEFYRDLNLQVSEMKGYLGFTQSGQEIQQSYDEVLKKAMDAADFQLDGTKTIEQAWKDFADKNNQKAKDVQNLAAQIRGLKLDQVMYDFMMSMNDTLASSQFDARKAGMSDRSSGQLDNQLDMIKRYSESYLNNSGDKDTYTQISNLLSEGKNNDAESLLKSKIDPSVAADYNEKRNKVDTNADTGRLNTLNKEYQVQLQAYNNQLKMVGLYGTQKELEESILSLESSMVETFEAKSGWSAEVTAEYDKQVSLLREQAALADALKKSWVNGMAEGLNEYSAKINDVASQVKSLTLDSLNGVEDMLVTAVAGDRSKGKRTEQFREMARELAVNIQQQIVRIGIQKLIMQPLMDGLNTLTGDFFKKELTDIQMQAKAVYINGSAVATDATGSDGKPASPIDKLKETWSKVFPGKSKDGVSAETGDGEAKGFFSRLTQGFSDLFSTLLTLIGIGGSGEGKGGLLTTLLKVGQMATSLFGGSSSGSGSTTTMESSLASVQQLHSGGVAGGKSAMRMVNPAVFNGARRYHTGTNFVGGPALAANEVPAILKKGERVLTASQQMSGGSSSSSVTYAPQVSFVYNKNGNGSGTAQDQEREARDINKTVRAAVDQAITEREIKNQRTGSRGYIQSKR